MRLEQKYQNKILYVYEIILSRFPRCFGYSFIYSHCWPIFYFPFITCLTAAGDPEKVKIRCSQENTSEAGSRMPCRWRHSRVWRLDIDTRWVQSTNKMKSFSKGKLVAVYDLQSLRTDHNTGKSGSFLPKTPVRFTARILIPLLQKFRVSFSYNPGYTDVGWCWLCGAWNYIGLMVLTDIYGEGSPHAETQASWAAPLPQHQSCTHLLQKCEAVRKSCLGIHATSEECLTSRKDPSCRRFKLWHAESKRWMLHRWLDKAFPWHHYSKGLFYFKGTGLRESLHWVWSKMSFLLTARFCDSARVTRSFNAHAKEKDLQALSYFLKKVLSDP